MIYRLEKSGDFQAMSGEKFCFQSSAGLGVVQVNADKALCNASVLVCLVRTSQEHLESRTLCLQVM